MANLYTSLIFLYAFMVRIAAFFNDKARKWTQGRKNLFHLLERDLAGIDRNRNPVVWMHVSSLGEFEQGRPVIEEIRRKWPEKNIVLTFFSPSGFEVRKSYEYARMVTYLPADTPGNVRKFLDIVDPELIIFVKYDFWFNFLQEISNRRIPLIYISVILSRHHFFFRWYGKWSWNRLKGVTWFFVQDKKTAELLHRIGIHSVTVAGDTRFDRVFAIAGQATPVEGLPAFCNGKPVFVAGSCWPPDETVFLPLVNDPGSGMKFIIAPHDTRPARVKEILGQIKGKTLLFSEITPGNAAEADVLVIDGIGVLNRLYQYATVAFIGGGYGSGLHNIQEPVTFGVPVFFGPEFRKFREASDLVGLGGAFPVNSTAELLEKIKFLTENAGAYEKASGVCRRYVEENVGATEKIIGYIGQLR